MSESQGKIDVKERAKPLKERVAQFGRREQSQRYGSCDLKIIENSTKWRYT
jgi:hypothetical protein